MCNSSDLFYLFFIYLFLPTVMFRMAMVQVCLRTEAHILTPQSTGITHKVNMKES